MRTHKIAHVRLSVGQPVSYKPMPSFPAVVIAVHDDVIPVLYDISVPLPSDPKQQWTVHNVLPNELRVVDIIEL